MMAGSRRSVQWFQNATRLQDIANASKAFLRWEKPMNGVAGATGDLEHRGYGRMHPAGFIISIGVEMSV